MNNVLVKPQRDAGEREHCTPSFFSLLYCFVLLCFAGTVCVVTGETIMYLKCQQIQHATVGPWFKYDDIHT